MLPLFLLFTLLPALELYFLIQFSDYMGLGNTLMVIILTGIWGAFFARRQGRSILLKIQTELNSGSVPGDSLFHGLLIFMGGVLLVTPGFFTDFLGASFIFPATRWLWLHFLKNYFTKKVSRGEVGFYSKVNVYKASDVKSNAETGGASKLEDIKDINSPSREE